MARYPHWTMEPCLHTADLERRLRLAAQRWLDNPRYREAWAQRLRDLRKDPEYAEQLQGASVDDALTNGVVAAILIEQGLLQMDIPREQEAPGRPMN
jgi:hypothetical protein